MGVARQDGLAGGGTDAGSARVALGGLTAHHPAVAAAVHFLEVIEGRCTLGQFPQPLVQGTVVGLVGRQYQQVAGFVPGEEHSGSFGPHRPDHAGAPDLGFEDAHQDVADLVGDEAVPRLPRFGLEAGDGVLGGQRVGAVDEGVYAGGVGVEDHAGVVVHGGAVGLGAGGEAEAAHELVLLEGVVADGLGPASAAAEAIVLHVPEAVLGGYEALGEEGVVLVFGAGVGDAEVVAVDFDLCFKAMQIQRSGKLRDRRGQLGPANLGYADHCVHLGSDFGG